MTGLNMRILVGITCYGTKNLQHLQRLIDEYASMPFDTHIVVLSEAEKEVGRDVEVVVGLPSRNPWSLPFAHREIFAERAGEFDLFIYSEDDTLVTEAAIRAFLDVSPALPPTHIAGFLRFEIRSDGERFCSSAHSHFHWEPGSVRRFGQYCTARFTNEHAACYMLNRSQLGRAIDSGGFRVAPHQGNYDMACTAATDPYTQCGMQKVIPISHFETFLLHHLSNRYVGRMGVSVAEMKRQIGRLCSEHLDTSELFPTRKRGLPPVCNKTYFDAPDQDLASAAGTAGSVLSAGCGWGATEQCFLRSAAAVWAIPLDDVVGESARARGLTVTPPNFVQAFAQLAHHRFDAFCCANLLHHLAEPSDLLASLHSLAAKGATLVGTVPNFRSLALRRGIHRFGASKFLTRRAGYDETLMHFPSRSTVRAWLTAGGWRPVRVMYRNAHGDRSGAVLTGHKLLPVYLCDSILFTAEC